MNRPIHFLFKVTSCPINSQLLSLLSILRARGATVALLRGLSLPGLRSPTARFLRRIAWPRFLSLPKHCPATLAWMSDRGWSQPMKAFDSLPRIIPSENPIAFAPRIKGGDLMEVS